MECDEIGAGLVLVLRLVTAGTAVTESLPGEPNDFDLTDGLPIREGGLFAAVSVGPEDDWPFVREGELRLAVELTVFVEADAIGAGLELELRLFNSPAVALGSGVSLAESLPGELCDFELNDGLPFRESGMPAAFSAGPIGD